jgi:hypothetical protein
MNASMNWEGIPSFLELLGAHGEVLVANGEVIETL